MFDLANTPNELIELAMKTKWAGKHLDGFEHGVNEWLASNPYRVSIEDRPLDGRHVRRLHIAAMEPTIPLHFSDFIHQLRSSLDHLTWQLCLKGNPSPTEKEARDIMFPTQEKENVDSFNRQTKGMRGDAKEAIRQFQPYTLGDNFSEHPLWQLHKMSNLDKHRSFAMKGGHDVSMFAHPGGFTQTDYEWGSEFSWPISAKSEVVFEPYIAHLMIGDPVSIREGFRIPRHRPKEILEFVRKEVLTTMARFVAMP